MRFSFLLFARNMHDSFVLSIRLIQSEYPSSGVMLWISFGIFTFYFGINIPCSHFHQSSKVTWPSLQPMA